MVNSNLCNLQSISDNNTKLDMEYDPRDPGGYFIINGSEWTVSSTESIQNNEIRIMNKCSTKNPYI